MLCHLLLSYGCPWTGAPCCSASSRLHQQRPDAGGDGDSDGDSDSVAPAHSLVRACTPCRADRADMCPHTHRVINISTDHIHTVTTAPSACIWHTLVIAAVTMAVACHEVCTGRLGVHVACRLMHPVGLFGCPCIHTPACHVHAT